MEELDTLAQRIINGDKVDLIRLDIADLIAQRLKEVRETLGYWEKEQFAHAIAALASNIHAGDRETTVWLRLCLVCIDKANVPPDMRSEELKVKNEFMDGLTYDQLALEIQTLGGRAS